MKSSLLLKGLVATLLLAGCARHVQMVAVPTPAPAVVAYEPTPIPPLPTPRPTMAPNSYVVKPGDCLWKIAGKDEVLGDSFEWPLLFKNNRDQILYPDEIEPAQDLTWFNSYDQGVMDEAIGEAKAALPYHRRRKSLPQP